MPGSTIQAGQLSVTADASSPLTTTEDDRSTAADDHGSSKYSQTSNPSSSIEFNSVVTLLGAAAVLQIGQDGHIIQQSGVNFVQVPSEIIVNPIINNSSGQAELTLSGPVQNLYGDATFLASPSLAAVDISNASSSDLQISGIRVINPSPTLPAVHFDPAHSQGFTYQTGLTGSYATAINISNTSGSTIILNGDISNPSGTTTISDASPVANIGGSIDAASNFQVIRTGELTLASQTGNIGSSDEPVNVVLVESSALSPSFQATATQGDVYLDLSTLNQTMGPLVVTSSALTANLVSIRITGGTSPDGGSFDLDGVMASELDVDAGASTASALDHRAE